MEQAVVNKDGDAAGNGWMAIGKNLDSGAVAWLSVRWQKEDSLPLW